MHQIKNTLFISYDGMTDPLGQSQVIPYLLGIIETGYHIFLLSCEKKEVFEGNKAIVEDLLRGKNITWVPLFYTKKPPVLSTLYDVIKLQKTAAAIHRKHNICLVHTRPGVPALVGLWLKKKYAIPFLNDIREFYADSRVDGGMWNLKVPIYKKIYKYFKSKEAEQVRLSDGIVCLTAAAEKIIRSWPDYRQNTPIAMIPCSVDLSLFDATRYSDEQKKLKASELGITKDDFVVSYLGSIGGWYLTEEMMRFCKFIHQIIPAAKFVFITPHLHTTIKEMAAAQGINPSKVIALKAARKEVPLLLSLSKFSIFFIKPCYSKLSSSPTKHGEIMGMGIPVVANSGVGDVKEIIEKYNAGIVLNEFTDEVFKEAAHSMSAYSFTNADNIRSGAIDFYSLTEAIKKYKEIYAMLLNERIAP